MGTSLIFETGQDCGHPTVVGGPTILTGVPDCNSIISGGTFENGCAFSPVALPPPPMVAPAVSALSEWGLIILGMLLAVLGMVVIRQRRMGRETS